MENATLGEILLKRKIISQAQLDEALGKQRRRPRTFLGQILVEMGVPQEKIANTLLLTNKRRKFGQILLDLGVITPADLAKALEQQRALKEKGIRKPLGVLLIAMGAISSETYLRALSCHLSMPIAPLEQFIPDPGLQRSIGERYALKNRIIVFESTPAGVKIALSEPTGSVLEEIRRVVSTSKPVTFHLASPMQLETCFRRLNDPFYAAR